MIFSDVSEIRSKLSKATLCRMCGQPPSVRVTTHLDVSDVSESWTKHYLAYCARATCPMHGWSVEVRLSDSLDEALKKWDGFNDGWQ